MAMCLYTQEVFVIKMCFIGCRSFGCFSAVLVSVLIGAITAAASDVYSVSSGSAVEVKADMEIVLNELPLLFADDSGVAIRKGVVRTIHPAQTSQQPVLEPESPWEGQRLYVYGSVYYDDVTSLFRLWYASANAVLYATSEDGVSWNKPALGIHSYKGSRNNNIIFHVGSPSVLWDRHEKDPAKLYKMLGSRFKRKADGKIDDEFTGYYAAYSADGLHWKFYEKNPVLPRHDTVTLCCDPRTGEYLAYHKIHSNWRGYNRRIVWLARSKDMQSWSEPKVVFAPDEEDDLWAKEKPERTEVYNMTVLPYASGFIGFPTIFKVTADGRPDMAEGQSPTDGPIDVQLATSRDGENWVRTTPRIPVIALGRPGAFDAGAILGVASTSVDAGDETWLYYTALTTTHGGAMPAKKLTIGRAVWRLHGFASLDAEDKGTVTTNPLILQNKNLFINADADGGDVRVEIQSLTGEALPGLSYKESIPLKSDSTRHRLSWNSGAEIPTDRPVRIFIKLVKADLFSLYVE